MLAPLNSTMSNSSPTSSTPIFCLSSIVSFANLVRGRGLPPLQYTGLLRQGPYPGGQWMMPVRPRATHNDGSPAFSFGILILKHALATPSFPSFLPKAIIFFPFFLSFFHPFPLSSALLLLSSSLIHTPPHPPKEKRKRGICKKNLLPTRPSHPTKKYLKRALWMVKRCHDLRVSESSKKLSTTLVDDLSWFTPTQPTSWSLPPSPPGASATS